MIRQIRPGVSPEFSLLRLKTFIASSSAKALIAKAPPIKPNNTRIGKLSNGVARPR